MKKMLRGAVAALALVGAAGFAQAQTYPPPQVTSVGSTDLIQIIPRGVPTAGNQYVSASTLLGGGANTLPISSAYSSISATPGTVRDIRGNISVGTGIAMTSGNLVGTRGEVNVPSGTSISGGYLYGVEGKFIGGGTTSSAANIAGILGQLDVSTGTYTAGVISAGWFDMGATASSSAISTGLGTAQIIRLTNTTAAVIPQAIYVESYSTNLMEVHSTGEGEVWHSATCTPGAVTGGTGGLRITIDGVTKWIPLAATCS